MEVFDVLQRLFEGNNRNLKFFLYTTNYYIEMQPYKLLLIRPDVVIRLAERYCNPAEGF